jgi:hypothetical protein
MSYAQSQFNQFHAAIRLDANDKEELRVKRETLLRAIKTNIAEDAPQYDVFHQGSYALHTGVNPLSGDPDMDIGLAFKCSIQDEKYKDPLVLKRIVLKALERHNRETRIRKPCVTVQYRENEQPVLHIDLAIYSVDEAGDYHLARGREFDKLGEENRFWEEADPENLTNTILNKFDSYDRQQWRRIVRYLKRWRDEKIGHKNLPSIALTIEALNKFRSDFDSVDGGPRDIVAMRQILDQTLLGWPSGSRLSILLPVKPYSDLMSRLTVNQMEDIRNKLTVLRDTLKQAEAENDTHEACKLLKSQFGDDFPVPEKSDTTKKASVGLAPTGRSA